MTFIFKCGIVVVGGWLSTNAAHFDQDDLVLLQTQVSSKRSRGLEDSRIDVDDAETWGPKKAFSQGHPASTVDQSDSTNRTGNHSGNVTSNQSSSSNASSSNLSNASSSNSSNATSATSGNSSSNATSGNSSSNATSDNSSSNATSGKSNSNATSGNTTSGNTSGNATSGNSSGNATAGNSSGNATVGNSSSNSTSGNSANATNETSKSEEKLVASTPALAATVGLDEAGYQKVVGLNSSAAMEKFILRTAESLDITVSKTGHRAMQGFIPFYSGEKAKSSFLRLTNEMKRIAKLPRAWLSPKGSTAPLNEVGFAAVAALHDTHEMAKFTRRVANEMMNLEVVHEQGLLGFAPFYSGEEGRKGYDVLQIELQLAVKANNSWLKPRTAPLQHAGQDCWTSCNQTGGYCNFCGAGNACCRKGFAQNPAECKAAMNYLTIKHECVAIATGAFAPLNEVGYAGVASLQNETQMERYIRRAAAALDMTVKSDQSLRGLVPFYSGAKSKRSFAALQAEMKKIASHANAWLAPRGETAQLNEQGYSTVAALGSSLEMAQYVRRTINSMHMQIKNEQGLHGLVPYYSGERTRGNFSALQSELRRVAAKPNSWLHQP